MICQGVINASLRTTEKPSNAAITVAHWTHLKMTVRNEEMWETETTKISKVLDSISQVMNWMERQSNCDHLHLLHLQNIMMYMMNKCHQLLCQKKILDYFKNNA
jgi:hypothetical protein